MKPKDFWNELRKNYKEMSWLYILILVLMVSFPLILHILYLPPDPPNKYWNPKWEIGNMLNYLGSCLGASVTIISLTSTIVFNIAQQNAQRRLAIKPYLSLEYRTLDKFVDSAVERRFITLENLTAKAQDDKDALEFTPPKVYRDAYHISGDRSEDNKRIKDFKEKFHTAEFLLSNIGADSAIIEDFKITDLQSKQILFNCSFALSKGHTLTIVFLLSKTMLGNAPSQKRFDLVLTYSDVASIGKYEQNAEFTFSTNGTTYDIITQQLSSPK